MSTNNIGISKDVDDIISTLNNKYDNEKGLQLESELKNKLSKFGGGITGSLIISGDLVVDGNINASISGTSENAIKASKDAQGRVIDETYATKEEISSVVRTIDGVGTDAAGNVTLDNVVHKTGAEDIIGQKVFAEAPWIKNNNLSIPEWTSSTINNYLYHVDKNKAPISAIQFRQTADVNAIRFLMRAPKDDTSTFSSSTVFWVGVKDDGTKVVAGVTPAAEDNSTKLATTEWVNAKNFIKSVNGVSADAVGNVTLAMSSAPDFVFSKGSIIRGSGGSFSGSDSSRKYKLPAGGTYLYADFEDWESKGQVFESAVVSGGSSIYVGTNTSDPEHLVLCWKIA